MASSSQALVQGPKIVLGPDGKVRAAPEEVVAGMLHAEACIENGAKALRVDGCAGALVWDTKGKLHMVSGEIMAACPRQFCWDVWAILCVHV